MAAISINVSTVKPLGDRVLLKLAPRKKNRRWYLFTR